MHYYLNEDKTYNKTDLFTWANQFEHMNRSLGDDMVNDFRVSTVWLGLDHNHFGGKPLLLETMIFDSDGNDVYCERYTTWDEALTGHKKAIKWAGKETHNVA